MRSAIRSLARRSGWRRIVGALLGMAVLVEPAVGQERSLIRPGDAQLRRELRSLQGQAARAAPGTALNLQRARRDVISRSRGVALSPEAARIDRGLDQVGRDLQRRRLDDLAVPPGPVVTTTPLPSSYREGSPLPSFDPAVTVGRLLGRAEEAARLGRPAQAQSDLATARAMLSGLDPAASGSAALAARLADVEAGLGAGGG
jgi:hypothetical protein